ncbi:MAG: TatD family hydrolase [bacterium]|nr:TatD family hydrolase [bacterium]
MKPKLFDIHSHLNFRDFDKDREDVIRRMQENGIWTICVGADKKTSQECVELAEKYENIFASVGLHPTDSDEKFSVDYYRELAKHQKVMAIGECGLDYYRIKNKELRIKQKDLFKQHIELALELNKPLMIHCRDAHNEVLEILNSYSHCYSHSHLRGNIHFFSGAWEQAQKYFDLGFSISFAGPITFTNQYDEIIKNAPIDKIMIETDSPFAAPAPYRGKRNEPAYVVEIAKKLAEIKNSSLEKIIEQTTRNAKEVFII